MTDLHPVKRALISVSDKSGIEAFAARLAAAGVELISTGGTARALREAGLNVLDVAEVTQYPEMMDGRVKTLHPRIHGGLLGVRSNPDHAKAMQDHDIPEIDLLIVNLYPFEQTVARGAGFDECIENIDIGGPALIRAAAKNHAFLSVVTDPADYDWIADKIESVAGLESEARKKLAAKAYASTAAYDGAIAAWFSAALDDPAPETFVLAGRRAAQLRYGENPHQQAALYRTGASRPGVASAEQIQGKALSYNNLNDADAAFELISEFTPETPAVAIIKHANPCGVSVGPDLAAAYQRALLCDPVSAFGGVIALNQTLTGPVAQTITEIFTEVVIAPDADDDAKRLFSAKKNLRLLLTGSLADPKSDGPMVRPIAGGFLVQNRDGFQLSKDDLKIVTKRAPSAGEIDDMLFAFKVAKHVKSNAIVYAKEGATAGIGAGQMSRLDSSRIAARKAQDAASTAGLSAPLTAGSVVASDAFFPFADGMLAAVEAGATAVIQPGGSVRDDEVIAAADDAGIAMLFTGVRHFRH
ncbi:MAG: bifunctional phosphoribosylaminoimidazolecarboxamide formyltransferase/IMP cyclohydrolase [Pseudomonadota bacterium]